VRAFLIKYQDRVLYGTDTDVIRRSEVRPSIAEWDKHLALDWRYFSTGDTVKYDGRMVKGLQLLCPFCASFTMTMLCAGSQVLPPIAWTSVDSQTGRYSSGVVSSAGV
jgi:hypothetical protein